MNITKLDKRPAIDEDKKLKIDYVYFEQMIVELEERDIPADIVASVNKNIDDVNAFSGSNKDLCKCLRKSQLVIFEMLEKEMKLVPKHYYRSRWMVMGMCVIGVPFGIVFGNLIGNISLLGVGIPIGMLLGIVIGAQMDKKAAQEGRQLDIEVAK